MLIRLHGEPLGLIDLPASEIDLQRRILDLTWTQLHSGITRHLTLDAITPPESLTMDGIAPGESCRHSVAAESKKQITVIVCTRNRPDMLSSCLKSLLDIRYPEFEIVVVDNAPDDSSSRDVFNEIAGGNPRFRYIVEPLKGLSRARNRGLAEASTNFVAFTDDDVVVDPSWLEGITRGFDLEPGIACVTGMVLPTNLESKAERYFERRVSWSSSVECRVYDLKKRDNESALFPFDAGQFGTGANFALDRRLTLELGGFDIALGAGSLAGGGEDLDMFVRILRSEHKLAYSPSALVWHSHRTAQTDLRAQMHLYGVGLGAYLLKQLFDREFRKVLLKQAPRAALHMLRLWRRGAGGNNGNRSLVLAELAGIVAGPYAYLRARLAHSRTIGRTP